jgi:hypothetical protein
MKIKQLIWETPNRNWESNYYMYRAVVYMYQAVVRGERRNIVWEYGIKNNYYIRDDFDVFIALYSKDSVFIGTRKNFQEAKECAQQHHDNFIKSFIE